jgi:phage terminase large subunit-like protein
LSCAKKNGKTALTSGIALYMLLADGEAAAEVYSAAADREQAGLVFKEMAKLVEGSTALQKFCRLRDSTKTVVGPGRSFYRAMSGESGNKDGPGASCIIFEELHAQPDRQLWDKLKYAGAARRHVGQAEVCRQRPPAAADVGRHHRR